MTTGDSPTSSQPPSVSLIMRQGPQPGQSFSLIEATMTIGREAGNDVVVNDAQVSRRHASLTWDGSQVIIQDLGSANGTFVNDERLATPRALQNGDVVRLGKAVIFNCQISLPVADTAETLKSAKPRPIVPTPPSTPPPVYSPPPPAQKKRSRLLLPAIVLLTVLLLLAVAGALAYFLLWPSTATARPVVVIRSPQHGQQVEVGQTVTVHAVASDETKITRMELWIDGQLHEAQNSALAGGASPFPLVVYWQPVSPGMHTLTARAFNKQGTRAHASIGVEAIAASADRDGDRVVDDEDMCPDEPGAPRADGCPDRDGDGIADSADACPDEAGMPAGDGCPVSSEGDRDGDGVLDEADACPDEPGAPRADGCPDADGDGVGDSADACPDEPGELDDGCPPVDGDGDGITDDLDDCPDESGPPATEGCPDADGDSVPDSSDACPDEPGAPEADGCPAVSGTDRDGDGIPDGADACPDEPGPPTTEGCPDADGDGVRDSEDACPHEPGPPESGGCPALEGGIEDNDGDGIPNDTDACPDEWGLPENAGCPDTDDDGVPDRWDLCPDEPGPPESAGCPDTGIGDRDGDGVPDNVDLCPDEPGLPEHAGCPPPGEGADDDGDGIPDDEEPEDDGGVDLGDMGFEGGIPVPVEFQALAFEVSDDYDGVYCYPNLAGQGAERHVFESMGERQWDIEPLGSRMLMVPTGEPVNIEVRCGADVVHLGPEGGWGTYYSLGSFTNSHPPDEWDGHVITVRSTGGNDGRWFETQYRICAGSCASADFPPPVLSLFSVGSDKQLIWMWDGDRDNIDGFKVYVDGSHAFSVPADTSSQSILGYGPLCGSEGREFYITAYRDDRESPPSNTRTWSSIPCDRVVQVTFDALYTYHLGDDEWWAHGNSVGPIYGNFWVSADREYHFPFHAVDYGDRWGERDGGYRLQHTHYYPVQGIFDWVHTQMASCLGDGCPLYDAPESNHVAVELGPYDDLTFGARIMDVDSDNPDDILFEAERTISSDDLRPGHYFIDDRNMELEVLVDILVGPEVGGGELPDLTVTDVTNHEESGQLRIHVFNNAANLENQDIAVNLVRISTNEQIDLRTWEDVSIPSGGERVLQSSGLVLDASDLRVIVDPDNAIDEVSDRNNIYETPVVMRVEFVRLFTGSPCDSFLSCDSEFRFSLRAGHGPSSSDVTWVGGAVRYPESGEVVVDTCGDEWYDYDGWYLDGQPRYTFEFEMPVEENVYIMATGFEEDPITDDSLGLIFAEYGPRDNYGHNADLYHAQSTGPSVSECSEGPPLGWDYFGFDGWWRITRVR